ncbi:MAG: UDP-N-acetylmuramate--L-alanine ligase [Deltaproteobacteria bacterium]|nr:UDP-N-acetylmuramate--L-alanine ligase [Deltaproteobacteria bacterium]
MDKQKIHFVGIAGIGMSAIADVLLDLGYEVQGSDLRQNSETDKLTQKGAKIFQGHEASHIDGANLVVYSSAVTHENVELIAAKDKHIPILRRAEMMAELMRKKRALVVAGSHGKTTTTSMVAHMMLENDLDPTFVLGGRLKSKQSNAYVGKSNWFVAESDESDGSFLHLYPEVAVITNIDQEHLNHYGSFDNLKSAFAQFASSVPFDGLTILCIDDPEVHKILEEINKPVLTVGTHMKAMIRADNIRIEEKYMVFEVWNAKDCLATVELPMLGKHNVLNALGAFAVGLRVGLAPKNIAKALKKFKGIDRRMDYYGQIEGVDMYDDYAHHPTEILATLIALKKKAGLGVVHVLYQPHRYTRLRDTWQKHIEVFDYTDRVYVTPVYEASETPIEHITSERLVEEINARGKTKALYVASIAKGVESAKQNSKPGDIICSMGAGSITQAMTLLK